MFNATNHCATGSAMEYLPCRFCVQLCCKEIAQIAGGNYLPVLSLWLEER
jgi:hypothetical protein